MEDQDLVGDGDMREEVVDEVELPKQMEEGVEMIGMMRKEIQQCSCSFSNDVCIAMCRRLALLGSRKLMHSTFLLVNFFNAVLIIV